MQIIINTDNTSICLQDRNGMAIISDGVLAFKNQKVTLTADQITAFSNAATTALTLTKGLLNKIGRASCRERV